MSGICTSILWEIVSLEYCSVIFFADKISSAYRFEMTDESYIPHQGVLFVW